MNSYRGSCHCGAIGFEYLTDLAPSDWPVRACQCSFCRAHDALSASDVDGELRFEASLPEHLQRYRFGLKTADFLLCRRCGVYIGAVIDLDPTPRGIINTHAIVDPAVETGDPIGFDYDGEDTSRRVGRRAERWMPVSSVPW